MKNKRILATATAMAAALALGALVNPIETLAATKDETVNVTYDNTNVVVDPDHPNTAQWGVSVQTAITFLDSAKTRSADVALVGVNGHDLADLADSLIVEVKVASAKGMKLELDGTEKDPVNYTLQYGQTNVTGTTQTSIAELTKTSHTKAGTATLTGAAKVKGTHKDILTYNIGVKTASP